MIKLVYEKKVDGVRKVLVSQTGIPASTDEEVVYNPALTGKPFIYTKSASNGIRTVGVGTSLRQIPSPDDPELSATAYGYDVINNVLIPVQVCQVSRTGTVQSGYETITVSYNSVDHDFGGETATPFDVVKGDKISISYTPDPSATAELYQVRVTPAGSDPTVYSLISGGVKKITINKDVTLEFLSTN